MALTTVPGAATTLPIVTTEGITTISYFATSTAGNVSAAQTLIVRLDKTAPVFTGAATGKKRVLSAFGWYTGTGDGHLHGSDAISGVFSSSPPTTLTANGANMSATGSAMDYAGNLASATVSGINIDQLAPTMTINRTPTSLTYRANGTPRTITVSGRVTDQTGLSGVDTSAGAGTWRVVGSVTGATAGGTFTVSRNGSYSFNVSRSVQVRQTWTFTVTTKDRAGNRGAPPRRCECARTPRSGEARERSVGRRTESRRRHRRSLPPSGAGGFAAWLARYEDGTPPRTGPPQSAEPKDLALHNVRAGARAIEWRRAPRRPAGLPRPAAAPAAPGRRRRSRRDDMRRTILATTLFALAALVLAPARGRAARQVEQVTAPAWRTSARSRLARTADGALHVAWAGPGTRRVDP